MIKHTHQENLPVLYQNIIFGLPSEFACDVFLWAIERPDQDRMLYNAERFAREADKLVNTLLPLLDISAKQHGLGGCDKDLINFILKRHANFEFGRDTTINYEVNLG